VQTGKPLLIVAEDVEGEAPSPFAGMHSQVKPGTSYTSQYGKKH